MLTVEQMALAQPGNHPYVRYRAGPDRLGRWIIECNCLQCGNRWRKHCLRPERTNLHIGRYAAIHAHGLRPVVR